MNQDISGVRHDYEGDALLPENAPEAPFSLFAQWMEEALAVDPADANAMTLASVDEQGLPHARIVLLKGYDENGFVFYTNYSSHKGMELATTGHAALVFWWPQLSRQVRIEGDVEKVEPTQSDAYFEKRPRGSQMGAWASPQSSVITGRNELEARLAKISQRFHDRDIQRPQHWGGFRLSPRMMEFWQGQPSRLHDRLRYGLNSEGEWGKVILAP